MHQIHKERSVQRMIFVFWLWGSGENSEIPQNCMSAISLSPSHAHLCYLFSYWYFFHLHSLSLLWNYLVPIKGDLPAALKIFEIEQIWKKSSYFIIELGNMVYKFYLHIFRLCCEMRDISRYTIWLWAKQDIRGRHLALWETVTIVWHFMDYK